MSKGLYVHIPYCKRKCKYCSFFSKPSPCVEDKYVYCLVDEIKSYKSDSVTVDTVYIGGGTPSLLSFEQLTLLFNSIKSSFTLEKNAEISIELNPESVDENYLKFLKTLGINRISFGVQSFNDKELNLIGRLHNAEKAENAVKCAGNYFQNINIDLMIGLPAQTIDTFKQTLSTALSLPITHISVYSLIVEEETPIYKMIENGLSLPTEDETVEMYDLAYETLGKHSFQRYEISNFAKKGYECKHNLNCWRFKEYIGIGSSAHSFYKNIRYSNPEKLFDFSGKSKKIIYPNDGNDRIAEYIMLALRTFEGVQKANFKEYFGKDFNSLFERTLSKQEIKTACENTENNFKIKDVYFYISNSIIVDFLEDL